MGHSWSFVFRNRSSEVGSPCRSLAGPSSEVGSPCRSLAGRSSEVGSPCRSLAGPSSEVGSPCRSLAGPSSEVGSPCRSLAGRSSEVGSLIHAGGGRPPSFGFDILFILSGFLFYGVKEKRRAEPSAVAEAPPSLKSSPHRENPPEKPPVLTHNNKP